MRLLRFIGYFTALRKILGIAYACAFGLSYTLAVINSPRGGRLARVRMGPYIFYFSSRVVFASLINEIFFKQTYYLAKTDRPLRVIDCGANIGISLLYIKLRAPHAKVDCFEPNPAARAVLEKNIAVNNWANDVRVFPYALGKEKGVATFFVDNVVATSSGGSVVHHKKHKADHTASYPVDVEILSSYISEPIDLLKIDIEGAEFDVLEELTTKNSLQHVSSLQLEYHYIPGSVTRPLSQMLSLLESHGFRTFVESETSPERMIGRESWHTYMVFAWRDATSPPTAMA